MEKVLVCGAGGFIGSHLVASLKEQGFYVVGVDLKYPDFWETKADKFLIANLRNQFAVEMVMSSEKFDYVYQLAADMGGAGYIFTKEHDADIIYNSAMINLNVLNASVQFGVKKILYTSSACIYPAYNQIDPSNPTCTENSAYPADPDSEYGWEKLFSERVYMTYAREKKIETRIARLHNVFGPYGSWDNGKEKAPAALCRKVAESNGSIDIWGPGTQTRSFLYIDECITGLHKLFESDCTEPVNLGSDYMISINDLALLVADVAQKDITINNVPGPVGVMGRNSENTFIKSALGWSPNTDLRAGIERTYKWIAEQVSKKSKE